MNPQKFTIAVVGLVVMILVITSVVLPVVQNAQHEQVTKANNIDATYSIIKASNVEDLDIDFTVSDSVLSVNGYSVTTAGMVLFSPDLLMEFRSGVLRVTDVLNDQFYVNRSTSAQIEDGVYSYSTYTAELEAPVLYASDGGTYGFASSMYANADSVFYCGQATVTFTNQSDSSTKSGCFMAYGTPADGITPYGVYLLVDGDLVDVTSTATIVNSTGSYDEETDVYTVTNRCVITFTYDGDTYTADTGARLYAPIEYTYISDDNGTIRTLFGLVPLLLIIVAVLYAVRLMGESRN